MCKAKPKLCFAASSGGHYEQLLMLRPLMNKYSSIIVTEKTAYAIKSVGIKTYLLRQVNRKNKSLILDMPINILLSLRIILKENPSIIICTGVLATIPLCFLAKIFGKKLIYIESFAKVSSATLSGRIIYRIADVFYVQWEQMLSIYPKAIYLGGIY